MYQENLISAKKLCYYNILQVVISSRSSHYNFYLWLKVVRTAIVNSNYTFIKLLFILFTHGDINTQKLSLYMHACTHAFKINQLPNLEI